MVRDPETGKYRRTRLFVLTLGYSRKSVRLLAFRSSTQIWAEMHERAFRRLGGVTRVVVLDNLKEGVLQPEVHDPGLNPVPRDMLAHYGATALPCRVRHPDRKSKTESGVRHAQTKLRGQRAAIDALRERYARRLIQGAVAQRASSRTSCCNSGCESSSPLPPAASACASVRWSSIAWPHLARRQGPRARYRGARRTSSTSPPAPQPSRTSRPGTARLPHSRQRSDFNCSRF